jgi:hypothetical protein
MPADSQHKDYAELSAKWSRCRHAIAGQDEIHEHGEKYLPKLKDQTAEDYKAYKLRASFFNATGRTVDGLVGMVFRKAPVIVQPDALAAITADIDMAGTTLSGLAEKIVREVVGVGRIGVLVEYPRVAEQPVTLAQASAQNLRPYASVYKAESIINWRSARVNNVMQLVLVVLREEYEESGDGFTADCKPQLRVLMLEQFGYQQQLYRKNARGEWAPEGAPIIPLMNGNPLPFIPFFAFGPNSNDLCEQDPPLLDLVDLNLAHYRVTADYEHGCHFTGLPMLFIAGVSLKENEKVSVGSQVALVTDNPQADGKFIEFTGQGMDALEKNLQRKENQMAAIGARMLAPEKAGVEAYDTLAMRHSGETSVLASIANMVSQQLTRIMAFIAEWEGIGGETSIKLNTDYMPQGMTAQELAELVKAHQAGAISFATLFDNLQRGEIIRAEKTAEQEKEEIADDGPPLGGAGNGNNGQ